MNKAEKLFPVLEEIGRQLVADELVPQWRSNNVQGSTEEKLQRLARWGAEESTTELAEIAARNAQGVLLALQGQVHDRVAAQLRDGGLPAAYKYLQDEAALWKAAQETLPLQVETARRERERLAQELRDKLQAIRQTLLGLRGRRLNQSLNELVALRNQMSQKEAQQARWMVIYMHLAEPMLNTISEEQGKLLQLEKHLGDLSLYLAAEAEKLRQQLTTLDVLEERVGSREDLAEYFAQAHVDLRPKLPHWLALTTDGVNQMVEETLEELQAVDQALAQHCLIEKRPDEFLRRIGQADRLAAPYVNLAYDPDRAPTLMMLLTGYQGDVNLAEGIPQGVPVTASDSLQVNEVILAQVRSGIDLEALAGLDEWRAMARVKQHELPLYTIDPTVLEPL